MKTIKIFSKETSGVFKILCMLVFYGLFLLSGLIMRKLGYVSNLTIYSIGVFIVSIGIAFASFLLIKTTKVTEKSFKTSFVTNLLLILIAFIVFIFLFGTIQSIKDVAKQSLPLIAISILGAISPGIFEEFLVRGLAFRGFYDIFRNKKYVFFTTSMFSSALFGLIHLTNLRFSSLNSVITQVIYAFAIGLVFSVIRIKLNGLAIPILIHSIIDLSPADATVGASENPLIGIIIIFVPIAIISSICLIKLDKDYQIDVELGKEYSV